MDGINNSLADGWYLVQDSVRESENVQLDRVKQLYKNKEYSNAFEQCKTLAQSHNDNGDIHYLLGKMHLDEQCLEAVKLDITECRELARQYFTKAGELGVADGYFNAGILYMTKATPDVVLGVAYIKRSAKNGSPEGLSWMGIAYQEGKYVQQNIDKAFFYFDEAANKGNLNALVSKGMLYQSGRGVPQDFGLAFSCFKEAKDKGCNAGLIELGNLCQLGLGVPQNIDLAIDCFILSMEQGSLDGYYNMAVLCQYGLGVKLDRQVAQQYVDMAIKNGGKATSVDEYLTIKLNAASTCLQNKEYSQAYVFLLFLAQTKCADAQIKLGLMHMNGFYVKQSDSEAEKYFKLALAATEDRVAHSRAALMLGQLHKPGSEFWKSKQTTRDWYKQVAMDGDRDDSFEVAAFLINAGHDEDHVWIESHLKNAHDKNHPAAEKKLEDWNKSRSFKLSLFS